MDEKVNTPDTATTDNPDAANRASEIGAMGVENEAAKVLDAELTEDDVTEISSEKWQRIQDERI